jgi:hypothetical protein
LLVVDRTETVSGVQALWADFFLKYVLPLEEGQLVVVIKRERGDVPMILEREP